MIRIFLNADKVFYLSISGLATSCVWEYVHADQESDQTLSAFVLEYQTASYPDVSLLYIYYLSVINVIYVL